MLLGIVSLNLLLKRIIAFLKDKLYSEEEFRLKSNYEKKLTNNLKTNCKGLHSYLLIRDSQKQAFLHLRGVTVQGLAGLLKVLNF